MILTGSTILDAVRCGKIKIDPLVPAHVNPNSIDLTLSPTLLTYVRPHGKPLDMAVEMETEEHAIPEGGLVLEPGRLYLGSTVEVVGSDEYVPLVEGRSSVGRLGISVHATAGVCDISFFGTITLEISVVEPVRVYPRVRLCQAMFMMPYGIASIRYSGKYQSQTRPTPSRMWRDFLK